MHKERLQLGPEERVRVIQVQGDLRLTGDDGSELRLQAGDEHSLSVVRQAGWVEIECRSGCLLLQPRACETVIEHVAGDLRAQGLTASLTIEHIAGDLNLRDLADTSARRVNGNLVARKVRGRLEGARVGGDVLLEDLQADVSLEDVGGDVQMRRVTGLVMLNAGGDVRLELEPRAGSRSAIRAGGDLLCVLPMAASAWLEVRCVGDLMLPDDAQQDRDGARTGYRLGSGAAEIALESGGDLQVRRPDAGRRREEGDVFLEDLASSVRAQVEGALATADAGLKSIESLPGSAEIGRLVQESLRSAGLDGSAARPLAGRTRASGHGGGTAEDAEQKAILEMLQAGKINSQEAEMLLRDLEAP